MSTKLGLSLLSLLLVAGCASRPEESKAGAPAPRSSRPAVTKGAAPMLPPANPPTPSLTVTNDNQVITLADQTVGAVFSINPVARFVILSYGLNPLPPIDQRLNVYRQGVKVGELRVSGPVLSGNIAADILAGDIRKGDQTRRD